ncbi:site-specific integrase [Halorhodospira sp. 9621]|uniref:tyrosine-type recombinase/integrase n=1 Tax=Halorhodospira sp. 9621 TaxID=2899135 RepID=UPI001EE7BAF7|nr:site-specific integrase [Halorhodospira sp. 9621]MCG5532368.1 site-specific integrase [Halorhodospira sp. 9621]
MGDEQQRNGNQQPPPPRGGAAASDNAAGQPDSAGHQGAAAAAQSDTPDTAAAPAADTPGSGGGGGALLPARPEGGELDYLAPETAAQNPAAVYLARLSGGSRRTMRAALDVIASELSGGQHDAASAPWGRVRYEHVQAVRSRLAERYAPATANKHLSALRNVLKEAWRLGHMSAEHYHRAVDVAAVRGNSQPKGRALTLAEAQAVFRACLERGGPAGARDAALFGVLYGGGLRRSEAVALDLDDFHENGGEGPRLIVRGKGQKARTTYLDAGTHAALADWIEWRGREAGPLLCPVTQAGRVDLRRMTDQAVYYALDRARQRANVEPFTPHDLRRSYAGDLLDAGADLATVRGLMGHASVETTANYDRRGERAKARAAALRVTPYSSGGGGGE